MLGWIHQVDLLANVGALLADTQSLLTRLQDGAEGDADGDGDDGAFWAAADASVLPGRQPSPSPTGTAAGSGQMQQGLLPADEVATDEVYEYQVRPAQNQADGPLFTRCSQHYSQ